MFAVIKTGGKQYKVAKDDELEIERLSNQAGETVQFNEVLMIGEGESVTIGAPFVEDAGVQAQIVEEFRGEKVYNFKRRRRKHSSKRLKGHRQYLTRVKVTDILSSGAGKSGVAEATGAGAVGFAAVDAPVAQEGAPGNLLSEAKGEADDLTRISGVGPKLNGLLNDNGVFHFWQIAEWTEQDVVYMDDKLSFKGRISRDNWIDQVKELMNS